MKKNNKIINEQTINICLETMLSLNGIFTLEAFMDYLKFLNIKNISETEIISFLDEKGLTEIYGYYMPKKAPGNIFKKLIEEKEKYPYHYLTLDEYEEYEYFVGGYYESLASILHMNIEEIISIFYIPTHIFPKETEDFLLYVKANMKLTKKEEDKIKKLYNEYEDYFRYWNYNGCTEEEYYWELYYKEFYITPKKNTDLQSCLDSLKKESLAKIKEYYDNPKDLKKAILANLEEEKIYFPSELIEKIKEDAKNIDYELYVDIEDILSGFIFVYKDGNKDKYIIPDEIKNILKEIDYNELEENITDIEYAIEDFVSSYVMMNGIIENKKLQELLERNQGFDISISELDDLVKEQGHPIIDKKYYSCLPNMEKEEINSLLTLKNIYGKYKDAIDFDSFYEYNLCEDLEEFAKKLSLSEDDKEALIFMVLYSIKCGAYNKETLEFIIDSLKLTKSKETKKELTNIINRYKDEIDIWIYNGFTNNEINTKKIKIGRNEKCPCGSGKKYKQCCGK